MVTLHRGERLSLRLEARGVQPRRLPLGLEGVVTSGHRAARGLGKRLDKR